MPSLQSLMFKTEEPIIGFWPGCQAPDLKEVARFLFHYLLDLVDILVMTQVPCLTAGVASTFNLESFRGKFVLLLFQVALIRFQNMPRKAIW